MLRNLLSIPNPAARLPLFDAGATRKLAAALAGLPPEWQVLRNRRARSIDGPPWVKFIVLHPVKGIALVDLQPADPETAIDPLDEFLARTGFHAFSQGDPPIVALALNENDIGAIEPHLAAAFAAAPSCGIKNTNWTEALIDLLTGTPGLLLTRITKAPDSGATEAPPRAPSRTAQTLEVLEPARKEAPETAFHAPISAPPPAPAEPIPAKPGNAVAPVKDKKDKVVKIDDPETPVGVPLDFEMPRHLWIVPAGIAASMIAGAIALVYVDRPTPLPFARVETEKVLATEEQTKVTPVAGTAQAEASPTELAPAAAPAKPAKKRVVVATKPVWEEDAQRRQMARAPSYRKRTPFEEFIAQVNEQLVDLGRRF